MNRAASYLYDAVYLYARALHRVIESKTPEELARGDDGTRDGVAIMQQILNQRYQSKGYFLLKCTIFCAKVMRHDAF